MFGQHGAVDLVDVKASPPFARIGVEAFGAGVAAGLVGEDQGTSVLPAQRMGTNDAQLAVICDLHGPTGLQARLEASPGCGQSRDGRGHRCLVGA